MFTHDLSFDPTYGYTEPELLKLEAPAPPADFELFWRNKFEQAIAVPTRIALKPYSGAMQLDVDVHEIDISALGLNGAPEVRIGGWLVRSRKVKPVRMEVTGHGYGGRETPDQNGVAHSPVVRLQICKRGFHRSLQPDLPVNSGHQHVLCGIESRETYVHLGNCCDLWAAVKALLELYPELSGSLDYTGGSFGGGIGAMAMPWDHRVRRVFLDVPSFGNHPLRLKMQCVGSGESVRLHHNSGHDHLPVLRYFDAATTSLFMDKPTIVGCARFDPAVPPPGQFSIYNAIPSRKKLASRAGGHFEYPQLCQEIASMDRIVDDWLTNGPDAVELLTPEQSHVFREI